MKTWKTLKVFAAVSVSVLVFVSIFTGCFSMPKNVEEIIDFSSVPAATSDPTPLEGIWNGVGKASFVTLTQEYTFSGNQFTYVAASGGGNYPNGTKGVFSLTGDTLVLYTLKMWNSGERMWQDLPVMLGGGYKIPAQKVTNTFDLGGGQFTLSNGKNSIVFSKTNVPTMVLNETTPYDVAQTYGLTLLENHSIVTLERKTETGMQTRIGEPEEWKVFINGVESKTIKKHETIAFVLPNGTHKIYVYMGTLGLAKIVYKSEESTINAQSNCIRLATYLEGGARPNVILSETFKSSSYAETP